jgi:virulence factor Mce-like protein
MLGRGTTRSGRRVLRKDRTGASPFAVGAIVLAVIAVGCYFGFTKSNPFAHPFKVDAVFEQATNIKPNSPVRIAGVNVGKVTGLKRQPGTPTSVVTMELQDRALPLHKDATAKVRPRIFLEGNFFVDLSPGTPSAPVLGDGDTLPMTQTAAPVQLDQVLTALQSDSRDDLQTILDEYGKALTAKPTPAQDRAQDAAVRGETAAQSLNDATRTAGRALRGTAITNEAVLGTEPHDLSSLIGSLGKVSAALDTRETELGSLVTNFNRTMAAFAGESSSLRTSIRLLSPTLHTASTTLRDLNTSFPATRAFAKDILPGVRATPGTIAAARPWIAQTRRLLGKDELRGLTAQLQPATADLSRVVDVSLSLLPQADLLAQCATNVILPTGDQKIDEGPLSTGVENYKEFWYSMAGVAGEGQNFDGNGPYVRFQVGGGDQSVSIGGAKTALGDTLFGNAPTKPVGTRPAYPGKRPPYNSDAPCKDQRVPDLNSATTGAADGGAATATAAARAFSQQRAKNAKPATRSGGLTAKQQSVTSELFSRLNPFRGAVAGK